MTSNVRVRRKSVSTLDREVASIDIPPAADAAPYPRLESTASGDGRLLAKLTVHRRKTGNRCRIPAPSEDLERLSRTVQLKRGLTEYKAPILVGYSSGATMVYAAVAAAPPETFAGAISLGFCPDLDIGRPPCQQNGLTVTKRAKGVGFNLAPNHQMRIPWMWSLQGEAD